MPVSQLTSLNQRAFSASWSFPYLKLYAFDCSARFDCHLHALLGLEMLRLHPEGGDLDLLLARRNALEREAAFGVGLGAGSPVARVIASRRQRPNVHAGGRLAAGLLHDSPHRAG